MTHEDMMDKIRTDVRETIGLTAKDLDGVMYYVNLAYTIGAENSHKTSGKQVQQLNKYGKVINTFPSASEAAKKVGAHRGNITRVCRGENHTCAGYIWKYVEN